MAVLGVPQSFIKDNMDNNIYYNLNFDNYGKCNDECYHCYNNCDICENALILLGNQYMICKKHKEIIKL